MLSITAIAINIQNIQLKSTTAIIFSVEVANNPSGNPYAQTPGFPLEGLANIIIRTTRKFQTSNPQSIMERRLTVCILNDRVPGESKLLIVNRLRTIRLAIPTGSMVVGNDSCILVETCAERASEPMKM